MQRIKYSIFINRLKIVKFINITDHYILKKSSEISKYLSELAGLLVTGLKIYTSSKARYMRYIKPTLNGVNRSNTLHTK